MFSAKILFILLTSTFFLQYTCQKQIRGLPERDYPTYYTIPQTSFSCSDQLYNPGFYADTETRCQVFHYCYEHRQESFLCPIGTVFNQPILACDYWYSSNCSLATSYYHFNADKRTEDHIDEADDSVDWQSKNLFDKMSHLYEVNNKAPETPVLKNDADISEIELLGRDVIESSYEPLIEKNNKTDDYNKYGYDNQFNMVDEEHPEVVKYEVGGLNALNIRESSENEEPYETDNVEDFIFSEDGMLHQRQEDIYQMYPTDMDFDRGHSGYAEIPSDGYFNYDLNEDLEAQSDFQMPDFVLQNRNAYINDYVRRPLNRRPVIVIPEAEPEMIQLPVATRKRKPIGMASTVSMNAEESSHEPNYVADIYKESAVSVANQGLEGETSDEFPLDESKSNLNDDESRDPQLFYEAHEEFNDENGSQLHQTGSLSVIYDNSNEKNVRNAFDPSNVEEISPTVFGSGSNLFSIESSSVLPGESSETTAEAESFDSDPFIGSGSEKNLDQFPSSDGSSFPDDQDIISDSEDAEITDAEKSSILPMNLFDTSEGSGISVQEAAGFPFGKFSPFETNEGEELLPDGSGGFNEFNLPHEFQEPSDNSQDGSDMKVAEIDGSYYVFSDSEHNSNYEFEDSNGFYSKNVDYAVTENFENSSDKTTEELVDNEGSLPSLDYQDSMHLENTYEKLPDEFEAVTSSDISEYIVDDSDSASQSSIDGLKYLEIMPQNPSPMLNLFELSNEKSNFDAIRDEMHGVEIIPPKQDISEQATTHEDLYEFESLSSDTSSDNEEHSVDIEPSETNSELLGAEQMAEEPSNIDDSGQVGSEILLPEQNLESFVSSKEADPFNPLFAESDKILLDGPESKQKLFSKVSPVMSKNAKASPAMGKDLKKVSRGKRFSENLQTFNPQNKDTLVVPRRETFRETMFTNIPSAFLKMKHSALRPYFYNYGLKDSGFNPRTGDSFESSKFSKLTSLGKRLLGAKFNRIKKYIDSYRYD